MNDLKNILILGLAAAVGVLLFIRGCGDGAPCPAVKTMLVYDSTEVRVEVPVTKTVTKYVDIWHTDTVVRFAWKHDTLLVVDTVAIVEAWLHERVEKEFVHRDTALEATITVSVYQNEATGMQMKYKLLRPTEVNTYLYDRFQFHTIGSFGISSDFDAAMRVTLGAGGLMEFKSGTGAGVKYNHIIGAPLPHMVEILVTQRVSFRKRR